MGFAAKRYGRDLCAPALDAAKISSALFHEQSSATRPERRTEFLSDGEKATLETGFSTTDPDGIRRKLRTMLAFFILPSRVPVHFLGSHCPAW